MSVGGDPVSIAAGGAQLSSTGKSVATRPWGISSAQSAGSPASGGSPVDAALARFAAAYGEFVGDVALELAALGAVAASTAGDLNVAGGTTGGGR
jgi:glucokinase